MWISMTNQPHRHLMFGLALALVGVLAMGVGTTRSDDPKKKAPTESVNPRRVQTAAERGLAFLVNDAEKWRKERKCATCHHGTMTVWALSEAKNRGYSIPGDTAKETAKWAKERLEKIDKPRDPRPGWKMVNTPAIYLALMARAVPGQEAVSTKELQQIAGHLLRHQEADGAWAWSSAPAKNRPPPYFESDEVATMLAYMALGPHVPANSKEHSAARDCRAKASLWLKKVEPSDSTQAAALRLLVKVWDGTSAKDLAPDIDRFMRIQNEDGGWGQLPGRASDPYATGQALYVLSLAGVKGDRKGVARSMAFLVSTQKEDGSWPMNPRAHPGASPAANTIPITYFGSAWATLGLMRWAPK
jgi:hypothetical protein